MYTTTNNGGRYGQEFDLSGNYTLLMAGRERIEHVAQRREYESPFTPADTGHSRPGEIPRDPYGPPTHEVRPR